MTWLAELGLAFCSTLKKLPPSMAALPTLRKLMLENCNLKALPEGPYLSCLELLDISENK
jgi:Leucine-rich repeat (LRR) protein